MFKLLFLNIIKVFGHLYCRKAKEHNKSIIVVIDYIPESIQQYQEQ